jgi:hypothetical protein
MGEYHSSGLNDIVVNTTNCYPKGAGFDSRVKHGFFPLVKEVKGFDVTNQTCLENPKAITNKT